MDKAVLVGYRYFNFTDNRNIVIQGYTLFLIEPLSGENSSGYSPVQFYDRYNNRPKYPSVSVEEFNKFGIANMQLNKMVNYIVDRKNHLVEFKQ